MCPSRITKLSDSLLKRPESVLVLITDEHQRVLLLQRKDDPNFWQSVTGTLEAGETPMDTALREVQEEIGVDIQQQGYLLVDCRQTNQYEIRPAWRYRYAPDVRFNTEYQFCLSIHSSEVIQLTEHLAYQWLAKSQALDKVWSDSNREAILRFVA